MSRIRTVYQTLRNKDNPEEVERDGPFPCNWPNAWLGKGYYFWETFINSAHWWGKAHCEGEYFICESACIITDDNCFDLVGNTLHLMEFSDAIDDMKAKGLINDKTTVTRVLNYLRNDIKVLKTEAIRAVGYTSIGEKKNSEFIKRMLFEVPREYKPEHYLIYAPAIQICFFKKTSLSLNGFRIIFPDEYNNNYVL